MVDFHADRGQTRATLTPYFTLLRYNAKAKANAIYICLAPPLNHPG